MLARLTSPRSLVIVFALLISINLGGQLASVFERGDGLVADNGVPVGTDFAVFYAAGRIVADGDGDHLYDVARNRSEFVEILNTDKYYVAFPYPAWMVLPYVALARLPYLWAYAIATGVMFGALAVAVVFLARVFAATNQRKVLLFLGLLAFSPLGWTIAGGQNTAFSLLCFAAVLGALQAGKQRSAGLWLGLLLFKPQLIAPLLLLLVWRRQWRALCYTAVVGLVSTMAGAIAAGPRWPLDYVAFLARPSYHAYERDCCALFHVSVVGMAESTFHDLGILPLIAAGVVAAMVVIVTVWAWRDAEPAQEAFPLQYGLALAATLVISPHALFYETSLLVIPIVAVIDDRARRFSAVAPPLPVRPMLRLFVVTMFIGGYTWILARPIGVQPMVILPAATFVLCLKTLKPALERSSGRTTGRVQHRWLSSRRRRRMGRPVAAPYPAGVEADASSR